MKSNPPIAPALFAFAILLSLVAVAISSSALAAAPALLKPQDLLRQMAGMTTGDCSAVTSDADVGRPEEQLFSAVEDLVTDRLNATNPAATSDPLTRARSAVLEVEQSSAEINKSWASEARFHFKLLGLHPAILAVMSYRGQNKLVLFSYFFLPKIAATDRGTEWREVSFIDPDSRASDIDLFPLHRGPSGRVRFLVRAWHSGCAGSIGEAYYGYEWSPEAGQFPTEIIKIEGAEGVGYAESKHVGKLSTAGKIIQLPYCFFSAVDTWDNPTLCAADSFDLSEDDSRFIGRIYNSPDLVVVNNAIHYAQAHDYTAVRAYCASDAVARKLLREIPTFLMADMIKRSKASPTREKIVFEDGAVYFNLVKRRGAWRLASFRIDDNR